MNGRRFFDVWTAVLLIVLLNFSTVIVMADLIAKLEDTEVVVGLSTSFKCSTTNPLKEIQWYHYPIGAIDKSLVFGWDEVRPPYFGRFVVSWINSTGTSTLQIATATEQDAGVYECADVVGEGEKSQAQLIVLSSQPVCQSSPLLGNAVGPNSCGIESDVLSFSCSVNYKSNSGVAPVLEWTKKGGSDSIKEGVTYRDQGNRVTSNLTVNVTASIDGNSYICRTTRSSTSQHPNCSTDTVKLLHLSNNFKMIERSRNETITCSTTSLLSSCSYKWIRADVGDEVSVSTDQTIKATIPGLYRCEAVCLIRSKRCTLAAGFYQVTGGSGVTESQSQSITEGAGSQPFKAPFVAVLVILIGGVIVSVVVVLLRRRRATKRKKKDLLLKNNTESQKVQNLEQELQHERNSHEEDKRQAALTIDEREKLLTRAQGQWAKEKDIFLKRLEECKDGSAGDEYTTNPILIKTITTPAAETNKPIKGIALLNNEIFIISQKESEVEVYDSTTLEFLRRWKLLELTDPEDATACFRNRCIYISESKEQGQEILRVDPNGSLIRKWRTGSKNGRLSVSNETNVILAIHDSSKLKEYSPDGELIHTIDLTEFGINHPMHALKLANGNFVVTNGYVNDDKNSLCEFNLNSLQVIKSFGSEKGSSDKQLKNPTYLAIDRDGSIMVSDSGNGRVILLGSNFEFKREIISKKDGLQIPTKITIDELNGRLHVVEYKKEHRALLIFGIK